MMKTVLLGAKSHELYIFMIFCFFFLYATSWTTPPASFIFFSASLLKYRAFTTMGICGIRPLPKTLEYPSGSKSRTGALSELLFDR
jgi:hypothetical protein